MNKNLLPRKLLQILEKKIYHPETMSTWQQIFSDYDEELEFPRHVNTAISSEITDYDVEIVTIKLMAYIMESYNKQTSNDEKKLIEIMGKMKAKKDDFCPDTYSIKEGMEKIEKLQARHYIMRSELSLVLSTLDQLSKIPQMVEN